jgi:uncharacterized SAM-binding protein YcdF (DUF218 family)
VAVAPPPARGFATGSARWDDVRCVGTGGDAPVRFDVIVVLGAALRPDGRPSPTVVRRVRHAMRLLRERRADRLLLSGGVGRHPPAEAHAMRGLALHAGAPPDALLLDDESTSTWENARNSARIMRAHGWTRALVVTDAYHLRRALFAFWAWGVDAAGSASAGRLRAYNLYGRYYHWAREGAALAWYAVRVFCEGETRQLWVARFAKRSRPNADD